MYVRHRIQQVENRGNALVDFDALPEMLLEVTRPMIRRWMADLTPEAMGDFIFYLMVGSANQNNRSLAMDGEVALLVSSWGAVSGLMDFVSLAAQSEWVEGVDGLAALLPRFSGLKQALARWVRLAL